MQRVKYSTGTQCSSAHTQLGFEIIDNFLQKRVKHAARKRNYERAYLSLTIVLRWEHNQTLALLIPTAQ